MRVSAVALVSFALLLGCAGTRTPKLAKCAGPYRYANPYGTVLPSLPISGRAMTPPPVSSQAPLNGPASATSPISPLASPHGDSPAPAKSSALLHRYPSC